MTRKTLCIVGAGPKAAAIAARAAVLRSPERRLEVPDIVVLERDHVGSAWSGQGGYSSGDLTLCSPPEKDVGFPYLEAMEGPYGPSVANELHRRFSWGSFLVDQGEFTEWVDRGREFPSHSTWADYLDWVFKEAGQGVTLGTATGITLMTDGRWRVAYDHRAGDGEVIADGVVLTGTGRPRRVEAVAGVPADRVLDAETFWREQERFRGLGDDRTVAVLGDGGAAGTIVAWLASILAAKQVGIFSINPYGTLLPRGDGYSERRWFSDPSAWKELTAADRRILMKRTEAGVVSLRLKSVIDAATNVDYRVGHATSVEWTGDELEIGIDYDGQARAPLRADYIVQAIGFDVWSLLDIVRGPGGGPLLALAAREARSEVELAIGEDLALPAIAGVGPGLHVPGLATMAQGPGMATLGCLGLLAAGILKPYVQQSTPGGEAT